MKKQENLFFRRFNNAVTVLYTFKFQLYYDLHNS